MLEKRLTEIRGSSSAVGSDGRDRGSYPGSEFVVHLSVMGCKSIDASFDSHRLKPVDPAVLADLMTQPRPGRC